MTLLKKNMLACAWVLLPLYGYSQQTIKRERTFQFSLAPAFGTNGLQPGSFINYVSANLTSGYSAKNLLLEVGTFSNLNTDGTRGLQFAGIANITGANAFAGLTKKEKDQKLQSGFNAHLSGAQFSGLSNIVIDEIFGAQFTGGVNLGKNALIGFQIAGVSNIIYKYTLGVQVSGLWNVSVTSMDGLQLSGLMNNTDGGLYGVQLGSINKAGYTEGKNSFDNTHPWGVQLGVINIADRMNGFQFGLLNFSRQSQGTQIGLINIYRQGKVMGTRDGTAIGLINIGYVGYAAVYANELFALNYEIATGNRKNGRIKQASRNNYVENALIYSHSAFNKGSWAIGYGLKKMFFSKSELPGMSEFRFLSYGIDLQHVNFNRGEFTQAMSMLSRFKLEVGTRLSPKLYGVYVYGALSYNAYMTSTDQTLSPSFLNTATHLGNQPIELWPGMSFGVLLH